VLPKQQKLAEVTASLNAAQAEVDVKMAQLNEAKAKVKVLQDHADVLVKEKEELEQKKDRSQK